MDLVKRRVNLTKRAHDGAAADLSAAPPDLINRVSKVQFALSKVGVADINAEVIVLLDHSGSMSSDYRNGKVQRLAERALAFALQVDNDGSVPIIAFDSCTHPPVDVTIDNYVGVIDREIGTGNMGSTNMAEAFEAVRKIAENATKPIYLIVIGDGDPDDIYQGGVHTTRAVCELASYPVFIKFLAIREVAYLQTLDDLEQTQPGARLLDNVDAKFVPNVDELKDLEFYSIMAEEWPQWIEAATTAGLLR